MPTKHEYVEPDVFLEHNGVTIYHAYDDHEYDDVMSCWYAVGAGNPQEDNDYDPDGIEFDVRELPAPFGARANQATRDDNELKEVLKEAIDAGIITNDGIVEDPQDVNLAPWQLMKKYDALAEGGRWGNHPTYTMQEWRNAVANEETRLGYWEWVEHQLEQAYDTAPTS